MTKREAAIVTAYTRVLIGDFHTAHQYIEEIMGRPVLTHELADKGTWNEIQALAKPDFISITVED
jgi:hypothetical protein